MSLYCKANGPKGYITAAAESTVRGLDHVPLYRQHSSRRCDISILRYTCTVRSETRWRHLFCSRRWLCAWLQEWRDADTRIRRRRRLKSMRSVVGECADSSLVWSGCIRPCSNSNWCSRRSTIVQDGWINQTKIGSRMNECAQPSMPA
jgi:hypothetical protein